MREAVPALAVGAQLDRPTKRLERGASLVEILKALPGNIADAFRDMFDGVFSPKKNPTAIPPAIPHIATTTDQRTNNAANAGLLTSSGIYTPPAEGPKPSYAAVSAATASDTRRYFSYHRPDPSDKSSH